MTALNLQSLAEIVTERMLNSVGIGVVLACLLWILLRVARRQNSRTRFAVWFLALLTVVALPVVGRLGIGASHLPMTISMHGTAGFLLSSSWALCLFALWIAGSALLLLRLCIGAWRIHQIRRDCSEVHLASLDPSVAKVLQEFRRNRKVTLFVSTEITVPAVLGFARPVIVFPARLMPQLSSEEVEVTLLHECAHLRRSDQWTNVLQKFVRAVFFFHPAVWWIERQLTLEREMACDDLVLAQVASPRNYASFLISFAEKLQNARTVALTQALVSRMHQMSLRVAQILDEKRTGHSKLWIPTLVANASLLALIMSAAPLVPRLVTFKPGLGRNPQTQMAESNRAAKISAVKAIAPRDAPKPDLALQPKAILASWNPRRAVLPTSRAAKSNLLVNNATHAKVALKKRSTPETFIVVQSTEFDSSGSEYLALCIWKINPRNVAGRQLESAIVLKI